MDHEHRSKAISQGPHQVRILFTLIASLFIVHTELHAANLDIVLEGAKADEGVLMIAVANSQASFDNDEPVYASLILPVRDGGNRVTLHDLPAGGYAISVFHDADLDGELNTNLMGIPTEAYGFSNNARGSFGPPTYDDCRFDVSKDDIEQRISLR